MPFSALSKKNSGLLGYIYAPFLYLLFGQLIGKEYTVLKMRLAVSFGLGFESIH